MAALCGFELHCRQFIDYESLTQCQYMHLFMYEFSSQVILVS